MLAEHVLVSGCRASNKGVALLVLVLGLQTRACPCWCLKVRTEACSLLCCFTAQCHVMCCSQAGPVWLQIHRVLGVPEPVLDSLRQRQQQSLAEQRELQQLRSRVAELELEVLRAQARGSLP